MPTRVTWRNLIPGLIALAVVALLAVAVWLFAGIGQLHGDTMRLYVATNEARGVLRGTEVWLAGQKVGLVERVTFSPPTTGTSTRVLITMVVRRQDARQIRKDSRADIRAGTSVIAPAVVALTSGTPAARRVRNGDTLLSGVQADLVAATAKMKTVAQDLTPLMTDARVVLERVHDPRGTIGAFLAGAPARRGEVVELRARVAALREMLFGTGGVAAGGEGRAASAQRTRLLARARAALARADSIRSLLASPNASLGRFRRDSTLALTVARIRDDLASVRAQIDTSSGTVGRLASDSALARALAGARGEMAALFEDIRRRPLHYVYF